MGLHNIKRMKNVLDDLTQLINMLTSFIAPSNIRNPLIIAVTVSAYTNACLGAKYAFYINTKKRKLLINGHRCRWLLFLTFKTEFVFI